jgi:cobyrinic acid a,c-diamide synthase
MKTFLIAGTHSGCGKTSVSLGLMSALSQRGLKVQAFKVGPDFIDPGHHQLITNRPSPNLDGWMLSRQSNQHIFARQARDADICIVEGVMGLFDGFSGTDEAGSSAQMAKWLDIPAILVVDARSMARSAAALVRGYADFDPQLNLAGVIFNKVGSPNHAEILSQAMQLCPQIPGLGFLPRDEQLNIPSRHLGLVTSEDHVLAEREQDRLATWIENSVDLDAFLDSLPEKSLSQSHQPPHEKQTVRIGVAKDKAFCFYYGENLRLLEQYGARLEYFSPLEDQQLPADLDGLYLGGGYPELHAARLSGNKKLLNDVREFCLAGRPVYAECGGFMYLMHSITTQEEKTYPMAGIFPFKSHMEKKFKALGYREVTTTEASPLGPPGTIVRGHEFHYSHIEIKDPGLPSIYQALDRKQKSRNCEGFLHKNVLGSYVHLHFASNPRVAKSFVSCCQNRQQTLQGID